MTGSRHTDAKRRERRALTVACALLVLCSSPAQALEPGDRAPAFSARALEGDASISLSQYRGKVVYLDFWASWCAPCAAALPALDALRKEFPQDQFRVLAVNVDSDPKLARQFLERRPVGYPSAADPDVPHRPAGRHPPRAPGLRTGRRGRPAAAHPEARGGGSMRPPLRSTLGLILLALVATATGCQSVRPWERGALARSDMAWDPDPLEATLRNHVYFSKEASLPGGGGAGGGCGCN
jgi:thiol-disulfide isomerase/thioredoxin